MRRWVLFALLGLYITAIQAQVEIFRNQEDTSTYIAPGDTITKPPQFETGERDFFNYIETHFNLRVNSQAMDLQGAIVKFSFYVEKDGSISDYKHLYASNAIIASEVERIVSRMPKWTPGYQTGKKKKTLMVYDLSVRVVNDLPMVQVTKNSASLEYTDKTNELKWFIVAGAVLVLLTLWIIK